jgi:ribosomal-protein-alanine N-acetyltransferase
MVMPRYWVEPLLDEQDLEGVLKVEAVSFNNPWTREMYTKELQNRTLCHIFVARSEEWTVAGFCSFWIVYDEMHINNVALRPQCRAQGIGTALVRHAIGAATELGAHRAILEVRASNAPARRLYERLGFYVAGTRQNYYTNPLEDALLLWRDEEPTS